MFNTGYKIPTDGVSVNTNSAGDWSYVSNLYTDNTSNYSRVRTSRTTDLLIARGFDFSDLPINAYILGIEVQVNVDTDFADDKYENLVKLTQGDTPISENKSLGRVIGTSWDTLYYGGNNDVWDTDLTATDIKNSNFGVGVEYDGINYKTIKVNTIRVKVSYLTGTSPLSLSAF